MKLRLGDFVIRRGESNALLFQITGFDQNHVILKGVRIPIITACNSNELIKINKNRVKNFPLKRIK